jgi:hypothetical protein
VQHQQVQEKFNFIMGYRSVFARPIDPHSTFSPWPRKKWDELASIDNIDPRPSTNIGSSRQRNEKVISEWSRDKLRSQEGGSHGESRFKNSQRDTLPDR